MKRKAYICGLDAALGVIGGKWKCLILWRLVQGPSRFGELHRFVEGITEKMLVEKLKELTLDGIIIRKDFRKVPPHVEYSLTELGHTLADSLRPLSDWGDQNIKLIAKLPTQFATRKV